jgi:hypothetical protein
MESHYNVKKGGLMWFMTMDDLVITDFPIIENTNAPHYDWVGSDSPSINGGRQLSYNSLADENELETVIIKYLNDNKFTLEKTKEPNCNWSNYREDEIGIRYTGVNDKGECLDLIIRINKLNVVRVEVSIII